MKALFLSLLILTSFSVISAEVGQKAKPEDCVATAATNKREPKPVVKDASSEPKGDDTKATMKK